MRWSLPPAVALSMRGAAAGSAWPCPPFSSGSRGPGRSDSIGSTGRSRPTGLASRPTDPRRSWRTSCLSLRGELKDASDLGEFGAARDPRRSRTAGIRPCPRCGPSAASSNAGGPWTAAAASAGPPPPRGWYLPDVAAAAGRAGQLRHRRGAGHQGRLARRGAQRPSRCTAAWSARGRWPW